jgi:hypothetical protein
MLIYLKREGDYKGNKKLSTHFEKKRDWRGWKIGPPILEDKKVGKINIHPSFKHKLA